MLMRILAAAATSGALMLAGGCAHAVGGKVDVRVTDRATGETLPIYWHDGKWWVPGKPGRRYAVALTNRGGGRVLTVVSVDGVNVISGETAAPDQTGYVLSSGQAAQITGWRKDMSRVAAFEFTSLPNSYAARTGRPDNVGVVGVAVFREKLRYVPPPAVLQEKQSSREAAPSAPAAGASSDGTGSNERHGAATARRNRASAPAMDAANIRRPRTRTSSAPRRRRTRSSPSTTTAARTSWRWA